MRRKRHEAQARAAGARTATAEQLGARPVGVSEPEERDVVPWLRRLGFNMRESRSAATLCADLPMPRSKSGCASIEVLLSICGWRRSGRNEDRRDQGAAMTCTSGAAHGGDHSLGSKSRGGTTDDRRPARGPEPA